MPILGLLLALCCYPLWRSTTPGHWNFGKVWLLTCAMVLLHIWLDVVTTYGTMIFLPFSHERVRLNGVFIIDLLLTLPLASRDGQSAGLLAEKLRKAQTGKHCKGAER